MAKPIRISKKDGVNPRTVEIARFPSFYSKVVDKDMKRIAEKHNWEIVRIVYDNHFFGFGWFDGEKLID